MKYVCLGYLEEKKWDAMSQSERDAFMEQCFAYDDVLRSNGHIVGGEALQSVRTATTLRFENGKVSITDGPFAETKEQLGGIVVLEARDLNHALQLMSKHPGLRLGCFEVRPTEEFTFSNRCAYMTLLGHHRYCDEVITQTDLLRGLLRGADLSLTVLTCPEWTLALLVHHIGGNLRSVEKAVRTRATPDVVDEQVPEAAGPESDNTTALDAWLADAATRFADTLREAGPDGQARVSGFQGSTAFWARRAAHDLVIHRADAAATLGADYTVAPEMAADAIDELLQLVSDPQLAESAPRLAELRGPSKSIHLHATDVEPELGAEWLIELGTNGFSWRRGHEKATVVLRGPLADVLRVFHRRLPPDSERVEVLGEAALLHFWLERVSLG